MQEQITIKLNPANHQDYISIIKTELIKKWCDERNLKVDEMMAKQKKLEVKKFPT